MSHGEHKRDSGSDNVLTREDARQYIPFPINHPTLMDMYEKHRGAFWTEHEIVVSTDYRDFRALPEEVQHFIEMVLAFFASSDGIVNKNLSTNFAEEIKLMEAIKFYNFQIMMEDIHALTYAKMLRALVPDPERQAKLFNAIEEIPAVQAKARWAEQWMDRAYATLGERLVAFVVVEGVFFSGSFCAIYWLQSRYPGKLPGLTTSNEFISRDEGLHCDFAIALVSMLPPQDRPSDARIAAIVQDAVRCEEAFIAHALPERLINMSAGAMAQYIQFTANRLMTELGITNKALLYVGADGRPVGNPFTFMEMLDLQGKTNFFEKRVTEYSKAEMGKESGDGFEMDADF